MKRTWKNLALSSIFTLTSLYATSAAAQHIPRGTRITQNGDHVIVLAQAGVTSTRHDDTAQAAGVATSAEKPDTIASQLYANSTAPPATHARRAKSLDEHCTTCPRPLGPLQPATITRYDADDTILQSEVQRLNAKEKCDRITKGLEDCVYPGQRIEAAQPLTQYQRPFFRFVVQPESGLTKDQAKAVRDIWRDGKVSYDELERWADTLPRDSGGKPYAAATLFSQVRNGAEECSYGMKVRAVKCEKALPPQITIPPPQPPQAPPEVPQLPPPAPSPYCGDNMRNQPTEECDGADTLPGRECTTDCKLAPEPVVEELPARHWIVGLGFGKTVTDITTHQPIHNELCPTGCTDAEANHLFNNTKQTAKVGYEKGNFAAELYGEREAGKDKQEKFGNFGGLKRFFATERKVETIGVDATYLANNGPARAGAEIGAEKTRTTLGATNPFTNEKSTGSVNTHEEKLGAVLATGQLDSSYAKITGGIKKGTVAPGIVAPSAQELPAFSGMSSTLGFTAPYASAGARLRVFNHVEISGSGEYTFMKKDSPIKTMWDAKAGAMYWTSTSTLKRGLGIGVEYGREKLDVTFPGGRDQTLSVKPSKPPVLFKLEYRF